MAQDPVYLRLGKTHLTVEVVQGATVLIAIPGTTWREAFLLAETWAKNNSLSILEQEQEEGTCLG